MLEALEGPRRARSTIFQKTMTAEICLWLTPSSAFRPRIAATPSVSPSIDRGDLRIFWTTRRRVAATPGRSARRRLKTKRRANFCDNIFTDVMAGR